VIRGPGVAETGSVCSEFVSLVDIAPTIADLCGTRMPSRVDGISLVPLLRGDRPDDWRDDIYAEFHGYESALCSIRMVRTTKWKYVYNPCSIDELYDLESDPGELHNLAPRLGYKHVLRRMKARLMAWLAETGDTIGQSGDWKGNPYDLVPSEREL
jgi:arylsulfatase A-like enzyme